MIGKTIGGATIGTLVLGVAVNSNKVVKQHAGDQESTPLTLFRRPEWFSPCFLVAELACVAEIYWHIRPGGRGCSGNQEAW